MARGVQVGYGPPALAALAAAESSMQGEPVTIVAPSPAAAHSVRSALGAHRCCDRRLVTLGEVCEQLGAQALIDSGRQPLPEAVHGEAVRAAVAASAGPLAAVARDPRSVRAVERALVRLRGLSRPALEDIASGSARGAELAGLLRTTRTRLRGWYDRHDLAHAAAAAVAADAAALADVGHVVLYLPRDLSAAEFALVTALAERGRLSAVLGACGDAEADCAGAAEADRLEPLIGPIARTLPQSPPAPTRQISTPDPETEIHAALRIVIEHLERGLPPHRAAILYTAASPYAVIAAEELAAAGIPFTAVPGTLGQTAAGRCLRQLSATPAAAPPSAVVSGRGWALAAGRAVALLEQRLAALGAPAMWPGAEAAAAQQLLAALAALKVLDELGTAPDPAAFGQAIERLLEAPIAAPMSEGVFVGGVADALGMDLDLVVVVGMAEGLAPPTAAEPLLPIPEAPERGARLPILEGSGPERGARLPILEGSGPERGARLPILEGSGPERGARLPILEGSGPERGARLPILEGSGPERGARLPILEGSGPERGARLPILEGSGREAAHRRDFLAALAAARTQRVVTFGRSDPRSARAQIPSRWLLGEGGRGAVAGGRGAVGEGGRGAVAGGRGAVGEGGRGAAAGGRGAVGEGDVTWDERVPSFAAGLDSLGSRGRDLASLLTWSGEAAAHPLVTADPALARGIAAQRARSGEDFTVWDGHVGPHRALLAEGPLRVSALQDYAVCGQRYLLRHVLRVAEPPPQAPLALSPLERWEVLHRVLKRGLDGDLAAVAAAELDRQARAASAAWVWELEREELAGLLARLPAADERLRAELGTVTGARALAFVVDGLAVPLRGEMDRLDWAPDRSFAVVLDYRTGRRPKAYRDALAADPVAGGQLLALPLYALAARERLGDVPVLGVYWFVGDDVSFERVELAIDDAVRKRFADTVEVLAEGVAAGRFPARRAALATSTRDSCERCPYDFVCPADRVRAWERKAAAPELDAYVDLVQTGAASLQAAKATTRR